MPAGQQIAFEPALAQVLAEHFHHPAVGRQMVVPRKVSAIQARLVTSSTSCQRLELVSSGLKRRKLRASMFSFITSRRNVPMTRVASAVTCAGFGTSTA